MYYVAYDTERGEVFCDVCHETIAEPYDQECWARVLVEPGDEDIVEEFVMTCSQKCKREREREAT